MYCPECGQQNIDQSKFCVTCGTALLKPSRESGSLATKRERRLAAIGLVGGILTVFGFFTPWQTWTYSLFGTPQSGGVSACDMLTGASIEGIEFSPTGYAYLAMFGAILAFGGALFCLAVPRNKAMWLVLAAGGILAVLAFVLGMFEVKTGSGLLAIEYSYGGGMLATLVGGLLSLVGFRGFKD